MSSLLLTNAGSLTSAGIVPIAPEMYRAQIDAVGNTLTMVVSRPVSGFSGASGFTLTSTGGPVTVSYVSGSGSINISTGRSGDIVFSTSRPILFGEVLTLAYSPGSVVASTGPDTGNPLQAFTNFPVTNFVQSTDPGFRSFVGLAFGGARSAN